MRRGLDLSLSHLALLGVLGVVTLILNYPWVEAGASDVLMYVHT